MRSCVTCFRLCPSLRDVPPPHPDRLPRTRRTRVCSPLHTISVSISQKRACRVYAKHKRKTYNSHQKPKHGHFETTFDRQLMTILQPVLSRVRLPAACGSMRIFQRVHVHLESRDRSPTNDPRLPVLRSLRPRTLDNVEASACLSTNNTNQRVAANECTCCPSVRLRRTFVSPLRMAHCRLDNQRGQQSALPVRPRGWHCQHVKYMSKVGHLDTRVERRQELSACEPHAASRPDDPRHAATSPEDPHDGMCADNALVGCPDLRLVGHSDRDHECQHAVWGPLEACRRQGTPDLRHANCMASVGSSCKVAL